MNFCCSHSTSFSSSVFNASCLISHHFFTIIRDTIVTLRFSNILLSTSYSIMIKYILLRTGNCIFIRNTNYFKGFENVICNRKEAHASPKPPYTLCSSTVTIALHFSATVFSNAVSSGFMVCMLITVALIFCSFNFFAACNSRINSFPRCNNRNIISFCNYSSFSKFKQIFIYFF